MEKRRRIWKRIFTALLCLGCLCLSGCRETGEEQVSDSVRSTYYDIRSETETLYEGRTSGKEEEILLGMQYYQGEPIQLWAIWEEEGKNIYLCRTDGSRELLGAKDIENGAWYIDKDGYFYCWKRSWGIGEEGAPYIRKLDPSGQELFFIEPGKNVAVLDLCQLEDESIIVLLKDKENGNMKLQELNPGNGTLTEKTAAELERTLSSRYIAAGSQGVLVLDTGSLEGLSEISVKDGKVLSAVSFLGTSYSMENSSGEMEVQDFRMPEEGKVEILWAGSSGRCVRETLSLLETEKIVVTLRTTALVDDGWLQKQISAFNRRNENYQVVLEEESGPTIEEQQEFGAMTAIQMATGKGPDILYGYALEYLYNLVEKGVFEDLAPYMESSGIREEDYFPCAFSCWRDGEKIYTFRMNASPSFWCIKEEILGGRDTPDIDTLLTALLDWEEDAALAYVGLSRDVLEILLAGSEDLWGMIDWEEGVCDFSGERFAQILKIAKKYGLPWSKAVAGDYQVRPLAGDWISCGLYEYKTAEELEKMGLVRAGWLFEDGCYPSVAGIYSAFAINANSAQKQGAWEFISYIMSEEVQKTRNLEGVTNRAVHMKRVESELDRLNTVEGAQGGGARKGLVLPDGRVIEEYDVVYTKKDMTEERMSEYYAAWEETREITTMKYMRVRPILLIIEEEAEYFFEGVKSLEETVDMINNRAGLYIGEHHQ